jgi:tetratricopeptide (TPR) repeat protein
MSCRSSTSAEGQVQARVVARAVALAAAVTVVLASGACSQIRGRKQVQEANELYKRGKYAEAVAAYEVAETLVPDLPTLWLNKGYTCRQLIAPGGTDAESRRAAACALSAFKRLAALTPNDPRADQLTLQTWFDIDDYPALEATFLARNRRAPADVDVVHGLQEVYYKWGKWREALTWSERAAALRPSDPEAQYAVGTLVWQVLSTHGGGTEAAAYDPWPHPQADGGKAAPPLPAAAASDVAGSERVELADRALGYLDRALSLRPRYPEALTYGSLLWRQKSFAFFADPIAWQGAVDQADDWQNRALATRPGKS